jgi:hypothetical protein
MRDSRLYLIHVTECLERINLYLVNGKADFMNNQMGAALIKVRYNYEQ